MVERSLRKGRGPIFEPPHASEKDAENGMQYAANSPCNNVRAIFLCVTKEF